MATVHVCYLCAIVASPSSSMRSFSGLLRTRSLTSRALIPLTGCACCQILRLSTTALKRDGAVWWQVLCSRKRCYYTKPTVELICRTLSLSRILFAAGVFRRMLSTSGHSWLPGSLFWRMQKPYKLSPASSIVKAAKNSFQKVDSVESSLVSFPVETSQINFLNLRSWWEHPSSGILLIYFVRAHARSIPSPVRTCPTTHLCGWLGCFACREKLQPAQ